MTAPTAPAETPPTIPEQKYIEQIAVLLAGAATVGAVVAALGAIPGIGLQAAKQLLHPDHDVVDLLELRPPALAPSVVRVQHRANSMRRAAYLVNAGRRVGTAVLRARRDPGAIGKAIEAERRHLKSHLAATKLRVAAAQQVQAEYDKESARRPSANASKPTLQAMAQSRNIELGWYAILDKKTSPECRAANGKNFDPINPPPIGLPGTVHPKCRCTAGPKHATNKQVASIPLVVAATNEGYVMRVVKLTKHEVDSRSLPELENKPGKTNWVEKSGGLPSYIKRIAKHLQAKGMAEGHAIAAAHNTCVRWAAGGDGVTAETQAKAAAALAEWNAKAAASH
jgi:SPP1 gp7 family putative phage head morphogenesis protein